MSITIFVIGLIVFFAHFLSVQFVKTSIPDVLVLTLAGILLGPVLGLVTPADFGKVGPLIATIALVIILFEGGTSLDLAVLRRSLGTTGLLSASCFLATAVLATLIGVFVLALPLEAATLLGVILGGTSPAVVIPIVKAMGLSEKPATVLVLESALTDVLCIVGVFALLQVHAQGGVEPGKLVGSVLAALVFAAVIGVAGGIGWLFVLDRVRGFPNTISSTLAYACMIYGLAEIIGFSGAIAALALGITLTNHDKFAVHRIIKGDRQLVPLNESELNFFGEAVFLLKTYFFMYLGISVQFGSMRQISAAIAMVLLIYGVRLWLTRSIFRGDDYDLRDAAITSMMAPKGLAAAVLATLPAEYGVPGGDMLRDVAFMVVLISIALTALLVMLYPRRFAQRFYARLLNKRV